VAIVSDKSTFEHVDGLRVLITGMGGELGSLVASLTELEPWAGEILGIDIDPPRRRLRRCDFKLIDPTDVATIGTVISGFAPQILLHLGVYEPEARASAAQAASWTPTSAVAAFEACSRTADLRGVVVRSGIEVYGRPRSAPDVHTPAIPTTPFGHQLLNVEAGARRLGAARGVPVSICRLAPVIGPHVPSPLGRLLRLPVVPGPLWSDPQFTVLSDHDAAAAIVAAAGRGFSGTLNVAGGGAISLRQTLAVGRRLRAPLIGPQWRLARPLSHMLGAPIPDHVVELLTRGRLVEASNVGDELGIPEPQSAAQVIAALYSWEQITRFHPHATSLDSPVTP
jgi:UDP-glucose 4-epimerase